jgi:hypothetical protein
VGAHRLRMAWRSPPRSTSSGRERARPSGEREHPVQVESRPSQRGATPASSHPGEPRSPRDPRCSTHPVRCGPSRSRGQRGNVPGATAPSSRVILRAGSMRWHRQWTPSTRPKPETFGILLMVAGLVLLFWPAATTRVPGRWWGSERSPTARANSPRTGNRRRSGWPRRLVVPDHWVVDRPTLYRASLCRCAWHRPTEVRTELVTHRAGTDPSRPARPPEG